MWSIFFYFSIYFFNSYTIKLTLFFFGIQFMNFGKLESYNHNHNYSTEQFHYSSKTIPCYLFVVNLALLSAASGNHWSVLWSYSLSVSEYHINGIIQIVAFWAWSLLLSIMHLRFIHIVSCIDYLFLLLSSSPLNGCSNSLLIHYHVEGQRSSVLFWVIMHKAATNICI